MGKLLKKRDYRFDVIVIDEASQLKIPESIIPFSLSDENSRIMIVGDDKQLPPIIKGNYSDPEEGEPYLHKSIFEIIRKNDVNEKITTQLYENFRMNDSLCKFPASTIYGESYLSYNKKIAKKRIELLNYKKSESLINYILSPDKPLVLCVLEGVLAGQENLTEAKLVAGIAKELRNKLLQTKNKKTYRRDSVGDNLFWKNGLFIVSPHHMQIEAIKMELLQAGLKEPVFVDTVEKMQGQECEVVIVSYGVSDLETAASEAEFIYSLNRLNVAMTRAKSKCIVFLPRPLLAPTLEVLENENAAEGLTFMLQLEKFCKQGERKEFVLSKQEGLSLTVYKI